MNKDYANKPYCPIKPSPPIQGIGVGLRSQHYQHILTNKPKIPWFEVLIDNYLNLGGAALDNLLQIAQIYPLTFHGVGLSIGSTDPLNREYLKKIKKLMTVIKPAYYSEHLSWISIKQQYLHDLMPLPFTQEAAQHVSQRIREVQDFLEQPILLENISSYLTFNEAEMNEWEFVNAVAELSDCYILLDINNIYVNSFNHQFDPNHYINNIDKARVKQFHLAGFENHDSYLLDTHGDTVSPAVWRLFQAAVQKFGEIPAIVEWDTHIPEFSVLQSQAQTAQDIMTAISKNQTDSQFIAECAVPVISTDEKS